MANKAADVSWTVLTPRDGGLFFNEGWLLSPLRWRKPKTVIVGGVVDPFHGDVPDDWIDRVFAVMALAPQHQFMVLTKRAKRMREWFEERWQGTVAIPEMNIPAGKPTGRRHQVEQAMMLKAEELGMCNPDIDAHWTTEGRSKILDRFSWPLPNVALGVTAEDQTRADERIPDLLATPAAKRFVSIEPMLGPVDLGSSLAVEKITLAGRPHWTEKTGHIPALNLVICGGESGPNARPMHPAWPRALRDQCAAAGVPFNFKQWGNWAPEKVSTPISEAFGSGAPYVAWADGTIAHGSAADHGGNGIMLYNIGKRRAGCLLDGVEHDGVLP